MTLLVFATIRKPNWLFAGLLALFLILAILVAWRLFAYSDDWFRAREHRLQVWYTRYPRLSILVTIASLVLVAVELIRFVRSFL